ncbi:MAG: hypothetical protein M1393_07690 [Candidatus Thermoplasmatota archaeon]|nr:hypothetical protein [Candidatus Thermoplasmatota archaeon]
MKGSPFRKRYVLIYGENLQGTLSTLDRELSRIFRSKRKYVEQNYAIYLTNQFNRDALVQFVNTRIKGVTTITTSGTIKKCKSGMSDHKIRTKTQENTISALFQN